MANDKTTIRLVLRIDKQTSPTCKLPIDLIYSVKGQRVTISTGVKVHEVNWDDPNKKVCYFDKKSLKKENVDTSKIELLTKFEVNSYNNQIRSIETAIFEIESKFKVDKVAFSSNMVKDKYNELRKPKIKNEAIQENIANWIFWYSKECTNVRKAGTIKCYTGLANHLTEFEKKYKQPLNFDNLTIPTLNRFRDFLNTTKGQNNITVAKQISTLKTLLKVASDEFNVQVCEEYKKFKNYKRNDADLEVIALSPDEFKKVLNIDLSNNERLQRQRDVFVFSVFTGFRYSDLADLKKEHIKDGFIKKTSIKTKTQLSIFITPLMQQILDKYQNELTVLPIISNTKCSKYIKEIAKLAGINEEKESVRMHGVTSTRTVSPKYELISIHTGRKTCVTIMLANGVPPQEVMAHTDHKGWKSFKRYVDINEKQKQNASIKAFSMFDGLMVNV